MDAPLGVSLSWFEQWRKKTGEGPPDFSALPAMAELPPLLQFQDGRPVETPNDWKRRRTELRELLEHYLWGRIPEVAPRVEALCARYGIPYNRGSFARQLGTTLRTIFRLALPPRTRALPA